MDQHIALMRQHARPMTPIDTGVAPQLRPLHDIRAVLFDVYGTMVISASGDVGTVASAPADAFGTACRQVGLELKIQGAEGAAALVATIEACHAESRGRGVEYPEVDIVEVWRRTVTQLEARSSLRGPDSERSAVDWKRLAIEYEMRINPAWPMPGLSRCLERLRSAEMHLGIVSNAQFFTPLLFSALLKESLFELGFSPSLCVMSYLYGQAKPGTCLFSEARESLERMGVSPGEVLYIGNDMLNDIMPAQKVGFKTALFAGDQRSLRKRDEDSRVIGVKPELVVTHWDQMTQVLATNDDALETKHDRDST